MQCVNRNHEHISSYDMVSESYVGMLLYFPVFFSFLFLFAWLCFCRDSFINQLPKELLKLHTAVAFTVTSPLLISVNQSSRQTRAESILPFDIFDTITPPNYEKMPGGRGTGSEGRERKLNYGVSSRNSAFCWRKLISLLLKCNYGVTRHQITGRTKEETVFLPPIKEKIKGLSQLRIRKWPA